MVTFAHPFWVRTTTETRVRKGNIEEPILALVDHDSEINILSRKIYEKGKWPIDTNHGWVLKAANNESGLYRASLAVPIKVGDVEVEQNFFVQNQGSYPIILGQPYITATRMETKVLDDGSHYARIRSHDGMKTVQFLTIRPNHERHRDRLREIPMDYMPMRIFRISRLHTWSMGCHRCKEIVYCSKPQCTKEWIQDLEFDRRWICKFSKG